MSLCHYCSNKLRHPLYVYLLSDRRCVNNPTNHHVVPYIGLASNPFVKLSAHNRVSGKKFGTCSQLTKSGAGYYQIEAVFGPMFRGGKAFKQTCRARSRKITSRIIQFCKYARNLQTKGTHKGASLYVRDMSFIRRLLRRHL